MKISLENLDFTFVIILISYKSQKIKWSLDIVKCLEIKRWHLYEMKNLFHYFCMFWIIKFHLDVIFRLEKLYIDFMFSDFIP